VRNLSAVLPEREHRLGQVQPRRMPLLEQLVG
jgi:hypothetical protein